MEGRAVPVLLPSFPNRFTSWPKSSLGSCIQLQAVSPVFATEMISTSLYDGEVNVCITTYNRSERRLIRQALSASRGWLRVQFFRLWTALAVLGASVCLWLYAPEYLTWCKRSIDRLVEGGSSQLPYPWGDRLESTIGNFGIWVQLTVAILIFRATLGTLLMMIRTIRRRKRYR